MKTKTKIQERLLSTFNLVQKYMPVLGFLFVCLSFVFIYLKVDEHFYTLVQKHQITHSSLTLIAIASIIYALVSHLLALAWCELLNSEQHSIPKQLLISVFGKSQIAKYLPGNVFHFIGRQVLSKNHGFSHSVLIRSTLWEVGLHALAAALMGVMLLITCTPLSISITLFITFLIVLFIGLPTLKNLIEVNRFIALGYYCLFHVLSALIFASIVYTHYSSEITAQIFLISMGAHIIAWLVGFVTPGAPGGLGVREFVLFMLLSPWVDQPTVLIAMVIGRLVTIIGDILFFLIGLHLGREYPKPVAN